MSLTVDFLRKPEDNNDGSQLHLILEGLNLQLVGGWFDTTNPVVTIAASRPTLTGAVEWETMYTSEPKLDLKEGAHPRWNKAVMSLHALCHSDLQRPIRIRVDSYSYSDNNDNQKTTLPIPMGYLDTTVDNILQVSGDVRKTAKLRDPTGTTDFGSLLVRHARIQKPRTSRSGISTCSSTAASNWRQSIRSNMSWSVKSHQQRQHNSHYPTKRPRNSSASSVSAATTTAAFANNFNLKYSNSSQRRDSSGATSVSSSVWHSNPISNIPIVIPDEMLDSDAVLRLTLEADLIYGGNASVNNNNNTISEEEDNEEVGSTSAESGWFESTAAQLLSTSNPHFQISTLNHQQTGDDDSISILSTHSSLTQQHQQQWRQLVYRSEPIMDTVTPIWKSAVVPLYLLCGGDLNRKFRVSIFSKRDDILASAASGVSMGYFDTTVMELKHAVKHPEEVIFVPKSRDGTKQYGTVRVVEASLPEDLDVSVGSDCDDDSEAPPMEDQDNDAMLRMDDDYDDHSLISEITGHVGDMGASLSEVTTGSSNLGTIMGEAALQEYYRQDNETCEDLEGEINEQIQNLIIDKEPSKRKEDSNNKVETEMADAIQKGSDNQLNNNKDESQELDTTIRHANLKQRCMFDDDSPTQQKSEEKCDALREGDTREGFPAVGDQTKSSDSMVSDKDFPLAKDKTEEEEEAPLHKLQNLFLSAMGTMTSGEVEDSGSVSKKEDEMDNRSEQGSKLSTKTSESAYTSASILPDVASRFLQVMSNLQMTSAPLETNEEVESKVDAGGGLPMEIEIPLAVERDPDGPPKLYLTLKGKDLQFVGTMTRSSVMNPLFQISASNGPKSWNQIYRSEHVPNSVNPKWKEAAISIDELCKGDLERPVRVSLYSLKEGGGRNPMGFFSTNVAEVLSSAVNGESPKSFGSGFGSIIVMKAEIFPPMKPVDDKLGMDIVQTQPSKDESAVTSQPSSYEQDNSDLHGEISSPLDITTNLQNVAAAQQSPLTTTGPSEETDSQRQVEALESKPVGSESFLVVTSSMNKRVSEVTWAGGDAGPLEYDDKVEVLAQNSLGRNTADVSRDEKRVEPFETSNTMGSPVPLSPTISTTDIFAEFAATLDKLQDNTNESPKNDALQSLGQSEASYTHTGTLMDTKMQADAVHDRVNALSDTLDGGGVLRGYKSSEANGTQSWISQSALTLPSAADVSPPNSTQPWVSQSTPTLPSAADVSYEPTTNMVSRARDSPAAPSTAEGNYTYGLDLGSETTAMPETTDLLEDFARTLDRLNAGVDNKNGTALVGSPSLSETKPPRNLERKSHELEHIKEQLKRSDFENSELTKSIEHSATVIQRLRGEASIVRAEKDAAETALKNHEGEKDLVMSFNNELLAQMTALEAKVKEKELLLASEHEKTDKLLSEKLALENQLSQTKQEKGTLEDILTESRAKIASGEVRLAEASESLSTLKVENEALTQSNDDQKRADALAMKKLREENEGLIDMMMKLQSAADDAGARLNEKDVLIAQYEEERKQHLHEHSILTKSLGDAKADATHKVTQLQETVNVNDRVIVNMKLQMDSLNAEKVALEAALTEARRETEEAAERLRRETDEVAARQREAEAVPERGDIGDMTFEARLAEKSRLDRRSLETMFVEAEMNLLVREERARTDFVRINALSAEVDALKSQLKVGADPNHSMDSSSEARILVDGLRKDCQALTDEKNALAKSLRAAEDLAKSCKDDLVASNKKGMMLSESVRARDRMVEKSQLELETLTQEKQALQLSLNRERLENEAKLKEANNRMTGNIGEALKATLQQAGAKVKVFEQKTIADASKIKELSNQNNQLHSRLGQVERLLQEHTQSTPQLSEALKERDKLITELKAQNSSLESVLEATTSDKEALVTACRMLEASAKENEAETGRFETAKKEAAKLQEELDALKSKIPRLEADAKGMFGELMEARSQISDLEASLQREHEIVEAIKNSRNSGSESAASREQLAEMEAERDAALKTTKKLQSKVKELKKDLDGATFAKGIYEGYWKDANTKIEEMKGFNEVKRKSIRKSVSMKSKASDDGDSMRSSKSKSKRNSVAKQESSLRKSVRASLEGNSNHSSRSSRSSLTAAAAAASLLGIAEGSDGEEEATKETLPKTLSIPATVVSKVEKSSIRRSIARVPRPSVEKRKSAEHRKSVRKSVREASGNDEKREPRKPRKSTKEEKEAREAARAQRSSMRKSLREASSQSSEGKKPRARIERSKSGLSKIEKKPRRKTEVITPTTAIPATETEGRPTMAKEAGGKIEVAATPAPPDGDVDLT